ncbi:hypothetical protein DEO72_LG2g2305 [Vigna unguiculata]|uniref:Uncharacterized protein n=1 Tax=Vigna unguiculata TaxID=3917 RepID=A0A4D6KYR7_VIGUN|nr:hypothetical protein DEO72_LG2g2305 [Vigna unguiculata]
MEGVWVRVKEGAATYGYVMAGDGTCNDCRLGEEKMLCVSGISIWQRQHGLGWSLGREREEEKREIRVAATLADNTFDDEDFDYKRLWSSGRSTNEEEVLAMLDCVQL